MKHFPLLRTRRLTVQLKELTIGDGIRIAAMPSHLEQAEMTAFLRAVTDSVTNGDHDPAEWTVQERMMAVCHYLASTSDSPDFDVGDSGHFSDYIDASKDCDSCVPRFLTELGGDRWMIRPVNGRMVESIERLLGEVEGLTGRMHWIFGVMASSLLREGEEDPKDMTDGALDEWILERMKVFLAFPQSDFELLSVAFWEGFRKLDHFFLIDFADSGIVALPIKEGADLPPARFPSRACVSPLAKGME